MIIFVTGGARSGKSSFALKAASGLGGRKAYVATAQPLDDEMKERIERHRRDRGLEWQTHEEPVNVAALLRELEGRDVVIIDCLTLWLSNVMFEGKDIEGEIEDLVSAMRDFKKTLFVVSNEVGMGIVPDNETARRFRDFAGMLNQKVAAGADEAYLIVSGIPLEIKGSESEMGRENA